MAFCRLQAELAKREEGLRVATTEVGTLQALLEIERQGSSSVSMMEKELVRLRHSHGRLKETTRDLGFDADRLLCTYADDDLILYIGFGRLCQAVCDAPI